MKIPKRSQVRPRPGQPLEKKTIQMHKRLNLLSIVRPHLLEHYPAGSFRQTALLKANRCYRWPGVTGLGQSKAKFINFINA